MGVGIASLGSFYYYRTPFRFIIEDAWVRTLLTAFGNGVMTLATVAKWDKERFDAAQTHRNGV